RAPLPGHGPAGVPGAVPRSLARRPRSTRVRPDRARLARLPSQVNRVSCAAMLALLLAAPEGPASPIAAWESFYVIVGSSAAALNGLQFVVMTLIAAERRSSDRPAQVGAFGTPVVVHFCATLLISAILSAPWHSRSGPAFSLAALGLAGIGYVAI